MNTRKRWPQAGCRWVFSILRALSLSVGLSMGLATAVSAQPSSDAPPCPALPWRTISASVWAWMPDAGDAGAPPQPVVAVVDGGEALLIDPGPSAAHGQQVQQALACRFQARVRWVVLSHGDPDSVRGLQGLQMPDAAQVRAHPALVKRLAEGCTVCGVDAGRVRAGGSELRVGEALPVGRLQLQVLALTQAHSPGDALLWLAPEGVLWAGGLVDRSPVPEASRADATAWLQALERIEQQPLQHLMAHGHWPDAPAARAAVASTRQALLTLQAQVSKALKKGLTSEEIGIEPWPEGVPRTPALQARQQANVRRMAQVLDASTGP